ncbi:MAG: hypothetical protein AMXMBFR59_19410 [Rhodanobacteraceae bacterium]
MDRPLEQHEEPVRLVDFLAFVAQHEITRKAIVPAHQLGRALIAEPFDQPRGVDQITEREGAQQRRALARGWLRFRGRHQGIHAQDSRTDSERPVFPNASLALTVDGARNNSWA